MYYVKAKSHTIIPPLQKHESKLNKRLQLLHSFLCKIKNLMADDDSPYTTYVFRVRNNRISYERHVDQNKYCFLDEEYIQFVNDQYRDWKAYAINTYICTYLDIRQLSWNE